MYLTAGPIKHRNLSGTAVGTPYNYFLFSVLVKVEGTAVSVGPSLQFKAGGSFSFAIVHIDTVGLDYYYLLFISTANIGKEKGILYRRYRQGGHTCKTIV